MKPPALALLVATVAAAGLSAIAVVGAPESSAKPRNGNCANSYQTMSDSADIAQAAYAERDEKAGDDWMRTYFAASRFYNRYCQGQ